MVLAVSSLFDWLLSRLNMVREFESIMVGEFERLALLSACTAVVACFCTIAESARVVLWYQGKSSSLLRTSLLLRSVFPLL